MFLWGENGRKGNNVRMQKGSFTIEALIWIPLILCIMIGILHEGISFYEECVQEEISQDIREWDAVSKFYQVWTMKEIGENLKSEQK